MAGKTIKTHLGSQYDCFNGKLASPLFGGHLPDFFHIGSALRALQRSWFLSTILSLVSLE